MLIIRNLNLISVQSWTYLEGRKVIESKHGPSINLQSDVLSGGHVSTIFLLK